MSLTDPDQLLFERPKGQARTFHQISTPRYLGGRIRFDNAEPEQPIAEFCRRHGVRRLSVFGSILRDDFNPQSDVDVLVEFLPGRTPGMIGFGGMIGQGGYPPCMLDGEIRYYEGVLDKVFKSDDSSDQFYKPEKCRECSFDAYCLGPRRSYVEHYGEAEIKPFRGEIPAITRRDSVAVDYSAEGASRALADGVAPRGAMTVLK